MSGIHLAPGEKYSMRIVQAIRGLMQGRDDASGTVTLTPNATSTVVQAPNCASGSKVFLQGITLNAVAASTSTYPSLTSNGSFTLTHASATSADRTFNWTARG